MRHLWEGTAPRTRGPTGPFPESGPGVANAPAPAPSIPAPAQGSAISPAAASPTALSRKAGWGEAGVDRFPRSPGSLSGHPWTLGRAPARRCRSLRAGVPRSCAPLSGAGPDPFAASASSPGCQGLGAGRTLVESGGHRPRPEHPHLPFQARGPGGRPPLLSHVLTRILPALRAHRIAKRRPAPAPLRQTRQGLRRMRHEPLATGLSGKPGGGRSHQWARGTGLCPAPPQFRP